MMTGQAVGYLLVFDGYYDYHHHHSSFFQQRLIWLMGTSYTDLSKH